MRRRDLLLGAGALALAPALPGCRADPPALGSPRLDAHLHLTSPDLAAWLGEVEEDLEVTPLGGHDAVAGLDADGIVRAVALSGAYLYGTDFPSPADLYAGRPGEAARVAGENDYTFAVCADYPHRLIPVCSLNPKRDYALGELERCIDTLGARGLKLHLWNANVDLRNERQQRRLGEILSFAGERRMTLLVHVLNGEMPEFGADDLARFVELCPPALRVCYAHAGGAGGYDERVADLLDTLLVLRDRGAIDADRTWIELAAVFPGVDAAAQGLLATEEGRARLGRQLAAWGTDRILWGSDGDPDYLEATRAAWPLTRADLAAVLAADGQALWGAEDQRGDQA